MISLIARYGIVGGLIVIIPMVWRMSTLAHGEGGPDGMLLGYLTMIVGLTAVFLGIKAYRDKVLGGVIKFGRAFGLGLAISAVASVVYVIGWEIWLATGGVDFTAYYSKAMLDGARAAGASPAELQKVAADVETFKQIYANPLLRMPITFIEMFPVGIVVSLISAALLRNSRLLPARAAA
jgi:hypothetical protein